MTDAVDPVDYFLADVTTFGVRDGPGFEAAFERDVGLVHVRAKPGNARLDARRLERPPTAWPAALFLYRRCQSVRHCAERIVWYEQVKASRAQPRVVYQINFAHCGVGNFYRGEGLGGNFWEQRQRADGHFSIWPLCA